MKTLVMNLINTCRTRLSALQALVVVLHACILMKRACDLGTSVGAYWNEP